MDKSLESEPEPEPERITEKEEKEEEEEQNSLQIKDNFIKRYYFCIWPGFPLSIPEVIII